MSLAGKDVLAMADVTHADRQRLFNLARDFRERKNQHKGRLTFAQGNILATLFFEPSTRTQYSFLAAMERLGGKTLQFNADQSTSVRKGETFEDTVLMFSQYADLLVTRHPLEGSAQTAARLSSIPVINGGDGTHEHPTQTLMDLFTIEDEIGLSKDLTVGFLGDLHYSRTAAALLIALTDYTKHFHAIAPENLGFRPPALEAAKLKKANVHVHHTLTDKTLSELDVLYVTRPQRERMAQPLESQFNYQLSPKHLKVMKKKSIILHPLPRTNELPAEIDKDPRAAYFRQAHNGLLIRMALIQEVLGL